MDQAVIPDPLPPQKKSSKKWLVISVIVVIVVIGILLYPWAKGRLELFALRNEFSLTRHPELALVPIPLDLSSVNVTNSQSFSYYGTTFSVPWSASPTIVTSKDNFATQLKFSGGQFITILNGSSYGDTASNTLAGATQDGLTKNQIESVYGIDTFSSDYNFLDAVLNATPQNSINNVAQEFIVPLKYAFFGFVGTSSIPTSIYSFSLSTAKGFELVGRDKESGKSYRINFLFDLQGRGAHDFVIGNATQEETNSILASVQMQ